MPIRIRKALISEIGDVSKISIVDADIADPSPNEVQVKVIYSGFSGTDINMRLGRYPMQRKAPLTPGYCFVGRVKTNGTSSKRFQSGDLVTAVTIHDAEAELINVAEKYLFRVPAGLDMQQVTALSMDWNTAYSMVMHAANVQSGQRVFEQGMSGAVGCATMVLCQLQGATVYGTASQEIMQQSERWEPRHSTIETRSGSQPCRKSVAPKLSSIHSDSKVRMNPTQLRVLPMDY